MSAFKMKAYAHTLANFALLNLASLRIKLRAPAVGFIGVFKV
jgi:hypothetical protein